MDKLVRAKNRLFTCESLLRIYQVKLSKVDRVTNEKEANEIEKDIKNVKAEIENLNKLIDNLMKGKSG